MEDCKNIAVKIFEYIIDQEKECPAEIILDFDSSDIKIHGDQEGKHYHGYYEVTPSRHTKIDLKRETIS